MSEQKRVVYYDPAMPYRGQGDPQVDEAVSSYLTWLEERYTVVLDAPHDDEEESLRQSGAPYNPPVENDNDEFGRFDF